MPPGRSDSTGSDSAVAVFRGPAQQAPAGAPRGILLLLRSLALFALIYLYTGFFSAFYLLLSPLDGKGKIMNAIERTWSRWILLACGIRLEVSGLDHLDQGRSCVVIANHQGFFDIWSLLAALPTPLRFVFKKELSRIPIFGLALKRGGHICIDRSNRRAAAESIRSGRDKVVGMGASLVFFAEGTRSGDGTVGPFKKGGFITAIEMQLPILPVTVHGGYAILPRKSFVIRPGTVRMRVLDPVPTAGLANAEKEKLMETVRARIVSALDDLKGGSA